MLINETVTLYFFPSKLHCKFMEKPINDAYKESFL